MSFLNLLSGFDTDTAALRTDTPGELPSAGRYAHLSSGTARHGSKPAAVSGRDLAQRAGRGRRLVMLRNGRAVTVDTEHLYTAEELVDKAGRPVKFTSIPDRTKGGDMAGTERVLVFLDFANIDAATPNFMRLHYGELLDYLADGRFLVEAFAYVPVDPRRPDGRNGLVRHLQENGWQVYTKTGKIAGPSYKSNVDVEMCIDIMRSAQQIRTDIIVLCSGDGDFVPLVRELRRMGIRTEVASFDCSADLQLTREASGYISLNTWLEDEYEDGNAADENQAPEESWRYAEEAAAPAAAADDLATATDATVIRDSGLDIDVICPESTPPCPAN